MAFAYFPHTEEDIREMLGKIGASSLDDLYSDVSPEFIFKGEFDLPEAMSEMDIRRRFSEMAGRNRSLTVFCGDCPSHLKGRISDCLYPLSGRSVAGNIEIYLRISEHDNHADRAGLCQCLDV